MNLTARTRTLPTLTAYHENSEPPVVKGAETPESLILATQQARGSEWLQARGHGIPIMTGDPTRTHKQHKTQGQEDLPVDPKSLKHVRVKCSLESNARRGFAWKDFPALTRTICAKEIPLKLPCSLYYVSSSCLQ